MFWEEGYDGPLLFKDPLNVVSMADIICNYRPLLMPVNFEAFLFRMAVIYLHNNNSEIYEETIFKLLKFWRFLYLETDGVPWKILLLFLGT